MDMYESEHTKFIREYLENHPEERESQMKGRAVWWDHAGSERTPPAPVGHSPKAGGNEYLFKPLSEKAGEEEQGTK
jgi:hypothetical protein